MMACVVNMSPLNIDSEREEGEIVDDIDDLSDISSEEEFLLRQRLQVLENYNNVLERKEAKRTSIGSGKEERREDLYLPDLSEISASDLEDVCSHVSYKKKDDKQIKTYRKHKRRKEIEPYNNLGKGKEKKKSHRTKKRLELKVISESSQESDDEYRNKRQKLADAVVVNKTKNDTSSLKARICKMFSVKLNPKVPETVVVLDDKQQDTDPASKKEHIDEHDSSQTAFLVSEIDQTKSIIGVSPTANTDNEQHGNDITNAVVEQQTAEINIKCDDSEDDLELLRQYALKTKCLKVKPSQYNDPTEFEEKPITITEDEDSDTEELRLICLKSALLKKAIERKRKQKLIKKRLSQSSNWQDEFMEEQEALLNKASSENNTDIESVDMDIVSDVDEKGKEESLQIISKLEQNMALDVINVEGSDDSQLKHLREEELEEDEDLLRAKLLTSLSKNLPNLVDPKMIDDFKPPKEPATNNQTSNIPEQKKLIINLGESDSEGENEATKNLTKMHMKLSESLNFEQKLDLFLKSTRMKVENGSVPHSIPPPNIPNTTLQKSTEKFKPKAVNHLPKSEQNEYRTLVKRMAELEKMRQARQPSLNLVNAGPTVIKDTLKPRNISRDPKLLAVNNLDEKIAMSRKKIAEESAKMLQLKDEGMKLSQKYKIAATELRNISTAISLNKKQQRVAQQKLANIRTEHIKLLDSSNSVHFKTNGLMSNLNRQTNKLISHTRLQKENNPSKDEYRHLSTLKSIRENFSSNFKVRDVPKLSVHIDLNSNKKVVIKSNKNIDSSTTDSSNYKTVNEGTIASGYFEMESDAQRPVEEKGRELSRRNSKELSNERNPLDLDDYKSPLEALHSENWKGDPNAVLCPFDIGGSCRDSDCKYLHLKTNSTQ